MSFTNIYYASGVGGNGRKKHASMTNGPVDDPRSLSWVSQQALASPLVRMGHVCVSYGAYLIVWGGRKINDLQQQSNTPTTAATNAANDESGDRSNVIWVFHTEIEKWQSIECEQNEHLPRPFLSGACSILVGHSLYVFGGSSKKANSFVENYYNDLFELNLTNFKWKKHAPKTDAVKLPSPRDKMIGWAYKNNLYFFGGFGPSFKTTYLDEYGEFNEISHFNAKLGWNNQLVRYDLSTEEWHCDKFAQLSMTPKPRAAHTSVVMQVDNTVLIFGGRTRESRTNDLFAVNLPTQSCSKNLSEERINNKQALPCARSWHSMIKLSEQSVFVYGGLSQESKALGDAWLLNTNGYEWTQVTTNSEIESRLWHTATATVARSFQVYVIGGSQTDIYMSQPSFADHVLKICLAPETLRQLCLGQIAANVELYRSQLKRKANTTPTSVPSIPVDLIRLISLKCDKKDILSLECTKKYRHDYCALA